MQVYSKTKKSQDPYSPVITRTRDGNNRQRSALADNISKCLCLCLFHRLNVCYFMNVEKLNILFIIYIVWGKQPVTLQIAGMENAGGRERKINAGETPEMREKCERNAREMREKCERNAREMREKCERNGREMRVGEPSYGTNEVTKWPSRSSLVVWGTVSPRGGKCFISDPINAWKSYSHGIKIQIAANTIKITQPLPLPWG